MLSFSTTKSNTMGKRAGKKRSADSTPAPASKKTNSHPASTNQNSPSHFARKKDQSTKVNANVPTVVLNPSTQNQNHDDGTEFAQVAPNMTVMPTLQGTVKPIDNHPQDSSEIDKVVRTSVVEEKTQVLNKKSNPGNEYYSEYIQVHERELMEKAERSLRHDFFRVLKYPSQRKVNQCKGQMATTLRMNKDSNLFEFIWAKIASQWCSQTRKKRKTCGTALRKLFIGEMTIMCHSKL